MAERIAVVTGASSGIGWELARQLAGRGLVVWMVARREERLRNLAGEIARSGGPAPRVLPLDLGERTERQRLADLMSEAAEGLALVVNNAGFGAVGPTLRTDPARYRSMVELNITALTELSWEAARIFARRHAGGIINVASTAGFQTVPFMNVYSATKAYVLSFTEGLAEELKGEGVRVMALCPGFTKTEFQQVAGVQRVDWRSRAGMSAEECVRIGLRDYDRGKRISITGGLNKAQVFASWLLPRALVVPVTAKVMKGRA